MWRVAESSETLFRFHTISTLRFAGLLCRFRTARSKRTGSLCHSQVRSSTAGGATVLGLHNKVGPYANEAEAFSWLLYDRDLMLVLIRMPIISSVAGPHAVKTLSKN